jgi:uncharacterized protein
MMDKMMVRISFWVLSAIFVFPTVNFAASFDCSKATSEVEKLICGNDDLSRLDEYLHKAYLKALKRPDIKQQTIEGQKLWLKNNRNACRDAKCIRKAYKMRIKELGLASFVGVVFDRQPLENPSSLESPEKSSKPQIVESSVDGARSKISRPYESEPNRLR